ncbi:conserved hypothetical protein [Gloeothece citriformis PCC 7424]|uniref:DUF4327 domain-containing protein n=1 Tax=Gloeothece citriformis (strain PCC 7424) TaxID=65393 RepID=B7KAG2_GLOC7|nr:DUF4327 family protein [Gloeothece citriformis]ACK72936.1 conserved hypothetical protein [Gloeothece citriformis PCC 7424]
MTNSTTCFTLNAIKDEARHLVAAGYLERRMPILSLWKYIPCREWIQLECELERNDYLLRDPIGDLIETEKWIED